MHYVQDILHNMTIGHTARRSTTSVQDVPRQAIAQRRVHRGRTLPTRQRFDTEHSIETETVTGPSGIVRTTSQSFTINPVTGKTFDLLMVDIF